jgi:hypothetical protein
MIAAQATCCIDGIRSNGALCGCEKVQALREEFQKILAVSFEVAETWLIAKKEEVKAAHIRRSEEMRIESDAIADARHAAIWRPRYARGLTECVRCGGSGIWGNGVASGTCFRCGGNGIDPRRSRLTK